MSIKEIKTVEPGVETVRLATAGFCTIQSGFATPEEADTFARQCAKAGNDVVKIMGPGGGVVVACRAKSVVRRLREVFSRRA